MLPQRNLLRQLTWSLPAIRAIGRPRHGRHAANPEFTPFLGTNLQLGSNPDTSITGNRTYTGAHFLFYAGVVAPGVYR